MNKNKAISSFDETMILGRWLFNRCNSDVIYNTKEYQRCKVLNQLVRQSNVVQITTKMDLQTNCVIMKYDATENHVKVIVQVLTNCDRDYFAPYTGYHSSVEFETSLDSIAKAAFALIRISDSFEVYVNNKPFFVGELDSVGY